MKHFIVQELVPKSVYLLRGDRAIEALDPRILIFIEQLRKHLRKPIIINNWFWGGKFQQRGLRTSDSDVYTAFSQHTFGRALDFDVVGMTPKEVHDFIIRNRNEWWCQCITFIETGINWNHVDCRYNEKNDLVLWDVKTKETKYYGRIK